MRKENPHGMLRTKMVRWVSLQNGRKALTLPVATLLLIFMVALAHRCRLKVLMSV